MSERELSQNDAPGVSANLTSAPTQAATEMGPDGAIVGPYRLLQKIAEGGMGEIWLAEQKQPVRRRVALLE